MSQTTLIDGKPFALTPQDKNIPTVLKRRTQWVLWRYEKRAGKYSKVPYNAKYPMSCAASNKPKTWSSFDEALKAFKEKQPKSQGIGFCLSMEDGIAGIDLDNCRNPKTGEFTPAAQEILDRFKETYCEISPSGGGIRIFALGKQKRCGKGESHLGLDWVEAYDYTSPRYLTVTGHRVEGASTEVTHQQEALDWLHTKYLRRDDMPKGEASKGVKLGSDKDDMPKGEVSKGVKLGSDKDDTAVIEEAKAQSPQFTSLWSGDISGHNNDHSSADLALCNLLAQHVGDDAERIDRLFRQSGLMREKWDRKLGNTTYGRRTIDQALKSYEKSGGKTKGKRRSTHVGEAQAQWLKGFVYLPRENLYIRKEKPSTYPAIGFSRMAKIVFPYGWEKSVGDTFGQVGGEFVDKEDYAPGEPLIFTDDSGMSNFNTYRAPKLPPPQYCREAEDLFVGHIRYLADNDEVFIKQFLCWAATLVQKPGVKIGWVPLFISSRKGTGKSLLTKVFEALLGADNVGRLNNSAIGGAFQDALIGKQLLAIEEFKMFEDQNTRLNEFKTWVTENKVSVNRKGRKEVTMNNCVNFIASSNYENALNIDRDERRYLVANCNEAPKPPEYYTRFVKFFLPQCGGSIAGLLHYLTNYDLSEFNPYAPAAKTQAREVMADLNLTAVERRVLDLIESSLAGDWELVTHAELVRLVTKATRDENGDYAKSPSNQQVEKVRIAVGIQRVGRKRTQAGSENKLHLYSLKNHDHWKSALEGCVMDYFARRKELVITNY